MPPILLMTSTAAYSTQPRREASARTEPGRQAHPPGRFGRAAGLLITVAGSLALWDALFHLAAWAAHTLL